MRLVLFVLLLFSLGCQSNPPDDQNEEATEEAEADHDENEEPLSQRIRRVSPRRHIK